MKTKQKIAWIDYLKGFSMISVIVCHTVRNYYIRTFLITYNIPLFFLLSGYTSHIPDASVSRREIIIGVSASFKKLIVPAYLIWVIRNILYYFVRGTGYSAKQYLLSGLLASGSKTQMSGVEIPAFGMMWFLVALFLTRVICDLIWIKIGSLKMRHMMVGMLCIAGMAIPVYLPFTFDVVLVTLVFYHVGRTLKYKEITFDSKPAAICAGVLWAGVLLVMFLNHRHFELAGRDYPYYIVSVIMAAAASFFLCAAAKQSRVLPFEKLLTVIGCHSMILFIIHAFDTVWFPYVESFGNKLVALLVRLGVDLCLFFAVIAIQNRMKLRGGRSV